jgi:hypothetical protein
MADSIQLRRGTAEAWTAANTVLAQGEPGVETDTNKSKIGDGVTAWTSLAYFDAAIWTALAAAGSGGNIDGGGANSVYLVAQAVDGGDAANV